MEIKIGDNTVNIRDGSYVTIPTQWLFDDRLSPQDLQRLIKLWWRYDYFKSLNPDGGDEVFFHPQNLCVIFWVEEKSQPKVSEFLTKIESLGYIRRIRSGFQDSKGMQNQGIT